MAEAGIGGKYTMMANFHTACGKTDGTCTNMAHLWRFQNSDNRDLNQLGSTSAKSWKYEQNNKNPFCKSTKGYRPTIARFCRLCASVSHFGDGDGIVTPVDMIPPVLGLCEGG